MSLYIGIILLAFSVSPLSVMFTEKFLGPNMVEPFFFLGLYLIMQNFIMRIVIKRIINNPLFIISFLVISIQLLLGIASTREVAYVYADFRTALLLIFGFLLFQQKIVLTYHHGFIIKCLLWSIVMMDLIYSLLYFNSVLMGIQTHVRIRMVSPISCVLLMYLYLNKWKNINLAFLLFAVLSYHTIVSAMRNFYIIYFISLVILLLGLMHNRTNRIHKAIILAMLIIIPLYSWHGVYEFWMSDGSRQIHSINRVEEMINRHDQDIEKERINSVAIPFENPIRYVLPRGIGWRGYVHTVQEENGKNRILSTMDSTFYYISFHYGIIILLILLFFLFNSFRNNFVILLPFGRIMWSAFFILFATAFFTQATMMAYISFAFNYGMLLAFLTKPFYYNQKVPRHKLYYSFKERSVV